MKKLLILTAVFLITLSAYAQDKKELVLNQETNLIEAKIYHDNGVVAQTGFYTAKGVVHGTWVSFDAQGVKTAVANYNQGKKVGTWFQWKKNTVRQINYENNAIASVSDWKEETKLAANK